MLRYDNNNIHICVQFISGSCTNFSNWSCKSNFVDKFHFLLVFELSVKYHKTTQIMIFSVS